MADEIENNENADLSSQEQESQQFTFSMASEELEQEQEQEEIVDPPANIENEQPEYEVVDLDEEDYVELDEDLALHFIAEKKGMTVEEFQNSLTPKEQKKLAPEIEAYNDFYEK